jgi:hypothetical protein
MEVEIYEYGFRVLNGDESLFFQRSSVDDLVVVYYERNLETVDVIYIPLSRYDVESFEELQKIVTRNPEIAWRPL